jgi:hypothetical protein
VPHSCTPVWPYPLQYYLHLVASPSSAGILQSFRVARAFPIISPSMPALPCDHRCTVSTSTAQARSPRFRYQYVCPLPFSAEHGGLTYQFTSAGHVTDEIARLAPLTRTSPPSSRGVRDQVNTQAARADGADICIRLRPAGITRTTPTCRKVRLIEF